MAAVLLGEQVEYSGQPPVLLALLHYANVLGVFKELDTAEEGRTSISFAHYGDTLQAFSEKTVLITGAGGMLGTAFVEYLSKFSDVVMIARTHSELDVTDLDQVMTHDAYGPDFIVHCAADVNAERCEKNPFECRRVQVGGTKNITALAMACGAQVLYPQSFLIFDGSEVPIVETSLPAPMSVYGKCKYEAEVGLRAALPQTLVVRMAGFFGGDEKDKNFVGMFIRHAISLIRSGERSYDVGDRIWQPTYTLDLAGNCLALMAARKSGIYNMSCHGQASFFELAVACLEELDLHRYLTINPTTEAAVTVDEIAPRPPSGIMENQRLVADGLDQQRPWRDALRAYLARPFYQNMKNDLLMELS